MKAMVFSDKVLVTAQQLATELGVNVDPDASVMALCAAIMGAPEREIAGVRPHGHGVVITHIDGTDYIIVMQGAPDGNGNSGILFLTPPRYATGVAVFKPGKSRTVPSLDEPGSKRRRRHRDRVESAEELDPVKAALDEIERVAWSADPVGFAEAALAEVQAKIAAGTADYVQLEGLKREKVLAAARVREARAIVAAPGLLVEETQLWSNAFLWARDMLAAATPYEAELTRRAWVERWPTSGRLTSYMAEHELSAAAAWLAEHAPDVLARLTADDAAVSA